MVTPYPSHLLSTSTPLQSCSKLARRIHFLPFLHGFNGSSHYFKLHSSIRTFKPNCNTRSKILSATNMAAGGSDDHARIKWDHLMDKAGKLWDSAPQPVKSFPWERALENFIQLILDLTLAVMKYLCVPLLAVSSLSEMSYCAHERKLFLVPFPLLIGTFAAAVLAEKAFQLSPFLKDAEVPWHLIAIAIFFTLLKLPGPYYPYWGRILIPHFTNGGLLMTLRFAWLWFGRPRKVPGTLLHQKPVDESHSEPS